MSVDRELSQGLHTLEIGKTDTFRHVQDERGYDGNEPSDWGREWEVGDGI